MVVGPLQKYCGTKAQFSSWEELYLHEVLSTTGADELKISHMTIVMSRVSEKVSLYSFLRQLELFFRCSTHLLHRVIKTCTFRLKC